MIFGAAFALEKDCSQNVEGRNNCVLLKVKGSELMRRVRQGSNGYHLLLSPWAHPICSNNVTCMHRITSLR